MVGTVDTHGSNMVADRTIDVADDEDGSLEVLEDDNDVHYILDCLDYRVGRDIWLQVRRSSGHGEFEKTPVLLPGLGKDRLREA